MRFARFLCILCICWVLLFVGVLRVLLFLFFLRLVVGSRGFRGLDLGCCYIGFYRVQLSFSGLLSSFGLFLGVGVL